MNPMRARNASVEIGWLETFREVARLGSVTAAAETLGYTQSAVSRQIAALEKATGAHLFDRLPRGVRLTDDGRCLLGHADAVLDRIDTARRDLRDRRNLDGGRLRLGAFDTAEAALLPRAIAAFRAGHPAVEVVLTEANTPTLLRALDAGNLDLAIVSAYPGQEVDGAFLMEDPLLVALPVGHRFAGRETLDLAELTDESWIEGFPLGARVLAAAGCRVGFPVREWTGKQGFVAAGLGLALVPALAASAVRPDIVLVPLARRSLTRRIYAAGPRNARPPAPVAAFLPHLTAVARELAR
jgi:DNA-binding transcriptional LysR family regulator